MTPLPPFVAHALAMVGQFRYLLLFIGTIVEGPVLMVACGFLLRMGLFEPVPMFAALAAGDLVADVAWYYAGMHLLEPFLAKRGHFLSVTPELAAQAKRLFFTYHTSILFISKLTMGFGMAIPVLVVAGASRVPFRRYLAINVVGEVAFVAMMLAIGYVFGHAYAQIAGGLRWLFIASVAVITVALVTGVSRYAKQRLVHP